MNTMPAIRVDDRFENTTTAKTTKIYSAIDVRQGVTLGVMRYVLSISMLLAITAMAVIGYAI